MSQQNANYKDLLPLNGIVFDNAMMLLDVEPILNKKYYGINQNEWPQSKLLANKNVATEGADKTKIKSEIAENKNISKNGKSKNKRKPVSITRPGK